MYRSEKLFLLWTQSKLIVNGLNTFFLKCCYINAFADGGFCKARKHLYGVKAALHAMMVIFFNGCLHNHNLCNCKRNFDAEFTSPIHSVMLTTCFSSSVCFSSPAIPLLSGFQIVSSVYYFQSPSVHITIQYSRQNCSRNRSELRRKAKRLWANYSDFVYFSCSIRLTRVQHESCAFSCSFSQCWQAS
jgi:hypothetical protein